MSTFRKVKKKLKCQRERNQTFCGLKCPLLDKTVVLEPGNEFGSDDVLGGSMDLFTF